MISLSGILALAIICVAAYAARGRGLRQEKCQQQGFNVVADDEPQTPSSEEWCALMEQISGAGVICLDESLCVVAAGKYGLAAASADSPPDSNVAEHNRRHLIEFSPKTSTAQMIALAASARRGSPQEIELEWNGVSARVNAHPLGGKWVALRVYSHERGSGDV